MFTYSDPATVIKQLFVGDWSYVLVADKYEPFPQTWLFFVKGVNSASYKGTLSNLIPF